MKNILLIFLKFLDDLIQKKNIEIITKNSNKKWDTYIDIGSHDGEMINLLNKNFKIKKIFGFEPNPESFNNLQKLRIKNLKLYNLALSEKNGFDYLQIGHISSMSTINRLNEKSFYTKIKKLIIAIFYFKTEVYKKKIKIKKNTLSTILEKHKIKKIDLLKIDTEGHEFNILKGIKRYYKKTKIILFEFHYDNSLIKGYDFNDVDKFLNKKSFILISKNKMIFRKGYELIYKNTKY